MGLPITYDWLSEEIIHQILRENRSRYNCIIAFSLGDDLYNRISENDEGEIRSEATTLFNNMGCGGLYHTFWI